MQATGKKSGSRPKTTKVLTQDNPEQSKRFLEAAQEVEADETEEGAGRAFKKVTAQKPPKKSLR